MVVCQNAMEAKAKATEAAHQEELSVLVSQLRGAKDGIAAGEIEIQKLTASLEIEKKKLVAVEEAFARAEVDLAL